ncbi:hypothetical protein MYSTI_06822 [Myxococcus stipitatus DSM 14675]|uniref:Uncharacterized protein n=1 Tax=Myxococcus stipitatus (strain DSM 14675 / JCM 12634 / Mx s8) TaxID=1278073 RepID=L7UJL8_MYXSD|nr:hypothetical protein [Myxococcus stipitatus]AGC48095.1 hypothetical protein MYSTI_06822 [Myxococcus stipitatus DSM 14675]
MTTLAQLPQEQKKINCVWIGDGLINHLSAFNILSWISCGWTVTLYKHPAVQADAPVSALFPLDARAAFDELEEGDLSVVSLTDALAPETDVMPNARALLLQWIENIGVGYTSYAIGDLTKSFIAGTRVGIVLDLKIGPSPYLPDYPAEPFLNNFISFTRAGAGGVENQCLGSFNLDASNKYGRNFDAGVMFRLGGATFKVKTEAEGVFGSITGMHQNAFNKMRFGGGAKGTDVKTWDADKWSFPELVGTTNSGPFRVYQTPGYFNWKQGEYPEAKKANELLVADTLEADHGVEGFKTPPKPLPNDAFYLKAIQPMAHKAIKTIRAAWK